MIVPWLYKTRAFFKRFTMVITTPYDWPLGGHSRPEHCVLPVQPLRAMRIPNLFLVTCSPKEAKGGKKVRAAVYT